MLKWLDKVIYVLFKVELTLSVLTFAAIILMNCANLLSRWILHRPFDWILELSLILFVYTVMLVVPVLYKEKGFIQMHLIEQKMPPRAREMLTIFVDTLVVLFFAYLLPYALKLSLGQTQMLSRGLGIPRVFVTIPVSIAALLCIPIGISHIAHSVRRLREATPGNADAFSQPHVARDRE